MDCSEVQRRYLMITINRRHAGLLRACKASSLGVAARWIFKCWDRESLSLIDNLMGRKTPLRRARTTLGLLIAVTAAAQMLPPATKFMQAMDASMKHMDRDMSAAPMNGNVDHDFATMMMPHHQGAIDMAEAELSYGRDPVMRRLAQEIIVD